MTIEALASALTAAKEAADVHKDVPLAGTCNMDDAVFSLASNGVTKQMVEEAAALSGVTVRFRNWQSDAFVWVDVTGFSQGFQRTAMAEDACKALRKAGVVASVYYCVD